MLLPSTTDDSLLDNLPTEDLLRYAKVSRETHDAVSSYMKRRFKLEDTLRSYFTPEEIKQLRMKQFETGAVIGGSTALQFLDRTFYPESDLDIYVEFSRRMAIAFWIQSIGFNLVSRNDENPPGDLRSILEELEPPVWQTNTAYSGAFMVLEFKRPPSDSRIQLMITNTPVDAILRFHSTCVMNFITYEKAYALYPRGTFLTRQSLVTKGSSGYNSWASTASESLRKAVDKYKARGWSMITSTSDIHDTLEATFSTGLRRVGDAQCWTIPILPRLDLPESPIESNSWTFTLHQELWTDYPRIDFLVLNSRRLHFTYTIAKGVGPKGNVLRQALVRYLSSQPETSEFEVFDHRLSHVVKEIFNLN